MEGLRGLGRPGGGIPGDGEERAAERDVLEEEFGMRDREAAAQPGEGSTIGVPRP